MKYLLGSFRDSAIHWTGSSASILHYLGHSVDFATTQIKDLFLFDPLSSCPDTGVELTSGYVRTRPKIYIWESTPIKTLVIYASAELILPPKYPYMYIALTSSSCEIYPR